MQNRDESALNVAVIGAGLAGLTCARQLLSQGYTVHVFEKQETVSGRMGTIKIPIGDAKTLCRFDHGAQYFTARSPEFLDQVSQWEGRQVVKEWKGPFVSLTEGACGPAIGDAVRYVGYPGMDELCIDLARECFEAGNPQAQLTVQAKVLPLQREQQGWRIHHEHSATGKITEHNQLFDAVVVALTSLQATAILPEKSPLIAQTRPINLGPCLTVLLAFEEALSVPHGGIFVQNSSLRWVSNNSSMPGRDALPQQWVLNPSSEWSAEHKNDSDEEILKQVCDAFETATATRLPKPLFQSVFRWEEALPLNPASQGYFSDPDQNLILAGDWCDDARVEGAYMSGLKAALHLSEDDRFNF